MTHIAFWQGIVSNSQADLFKKFANSKAVLQALINNDYSKIKLAKKHSSSSKYPIYSGTITEAGRLLFTTVIIRGKPYILPLEELPTHNYQDSKFLQNKSLLEAHVAKHADEEAVVITEDDFTPLTEEEIQALNTALKSGSRRVREMPSAAVAPAAFEAEEEAPPPMHLPMTFYNNNFIQLDQKQTDTLYYKLPLMVGGLPGSGKSCLAMTMLTQWVNEAEEFDKPFLYITKSKRLADNLEAQWHALPQIKHIDGKTPNVLFKTYEELLIEEATVNADKIVSKDHFYTWYESQDIQYTAENLYQEFGMCSPFKSLEDYQAFGKQNLLYAKAEDRTKIWELYQLYRKKLEIEGFVHPPFYQPETLGKYQKVAVDEAQDLFPLQIEALVKASENDEVAKNDKEIEAAIQGPATALSKEIHKRANIVFFIDTHQSLFISKSVRPYIRSLFNKEGEVHLSETQLAGSYRSPEAVKHFANAIIQLKNNTVGSITDKNEMTEILAPELGQENKGQVNWFNSQESWEQGKEDILSRYLKANVVIIALKDQIEEAQRQFPGFTQIFTPEEIKGLEYELVIVYKPLSTPEFRQANKKLAERQKAAANLGHEDIKDVKGRSTKDVAPEFTTSFNNFFTSVTRTTKGLVIIQNEKSLKNIVAPLKATINTEVKATPAPIITEEQQIKGWYDRARELIKSGEPKSIEIAKRIFKNELQKSEQEFKAFAKANGYLKTEGPTRLPSIPSNYPEKQKLVLAEKQDEEDDTETIATTQKSTKEYSPKLKQYVIKLNKNFTASNLRLLLDKPLSVIIDILFNIDLPDAKPIMSTSLAAEKLTALADALFSTNKGFHKFLQSEDGLKAFKTMLQLNPDLLDQFKGIHLALNFEQTGAMVLEYLQSTHLGKEILAMIFNHNDMLESETRRLQVLAVINLIPTPVDEIYRVKLSNFICSGAKIESIEKFYIMCSLKEGCLLLLKLLELDSSFSHRITVEHLCTPMYNESDAIQILKNDENGNLILKLIYGQNPSLMSSVLKNRRQLKEVEASIPPGSFMIEAISNYQAVLSVMKTLSIGGAIYCAPQTPIGTLLLVIKMLKGGCELILPSEMPLSVIEQALPSLASDTSFSYVGRPTQEFLNGVMRTIPEHSNFVIRNHMQVADIEIIASSLNCKALILDSNLAEELNIQAAKSLSPLSNIYLTSHSDRKQTSSVASSLKPGGILTLPIETPIETQIAAVESLGLDSIFTLHLQTPFATLESILAHTKPNAHILIPVPTGIDEVNNLHSVITIVKPNTNIVLHYQFPKQVIDLVKQVLPQNVNLMMLSSKKSDSFLEHFFSGVAKNDTKQYSILLELMKMPPPFATSEIVSSKVALLKENYILELHPEFPLSIFRATAYSLKHGARLQINPKTSLEKVMCLINAPVPLNIMFLNNTPFELIEAVAKNLSARGRIGFYSKVPVELARKAASILKSGTYLTLHPHTPVEVVISVASTLAKGACIGFYTDSSSEHIRMTAQYLAEDARILLDPGLKQEDFEFVAKNLGPNHVLEILNNTPVEVIAATAKALERGSLCLYSNLHPSKVSAAAANIKPGAALTFTKNAKLTSILVALESLTSGTRLIILMPPSAELIDVIKKGEQKGVIVTLVPAPHPANLTFFNSSSGTNMAETKPGIDIASP